MSNLILHMGAHRVSEETVRALGVPNATATHRPIAHRDLIDLVLAAVERNNLQVTAQAHGLTHDNSRYFGLLNVGHQDDATKEWTRVIGMRNAHDKRFAAGVVAGSQVLVCDNLCFSGEIEAARKHTVNISAELPGIINRAIGKMGEVWQQHADRVDRYKDCEISDPNVHHVVIRAVDRGAMANSYIPKVLEAYREPPHEAFRPRTVWSLHNAFTEVFKERVDLLEERSCIMHEILDDFVR